LPVSSQAELEIETVETPLTALGSPGQEPTTGRVSGGPLLRADKWLREPLVHFLVAGALLLGVSNFLGYLTGSRASQNRIPVSASEIRRLREVWTRQWGHPPDTKQMDHLIDDYVREEVFYREALASGLDKDDTIIRRRLVEKMEFLSQEIVSTTKPSDSELQQFFERNREKYSLPAQVAFSHIYFSSSKRGPAAEHDARQVLAGLASRSIFFVQTSTLGDSFMLQYEYPPQTRDQIKDLFGEKFAARVLELETGQWAGPVRSSYGFHLVRVLQRVSPRLPDLSEVLNQVATDYKNERLQTASDAYYAKLRQRYRVEVDKKALAAAEPQRGQETSGRETEAPAPADVD
jgi:peptidyl-prolyl cis-trans isomerase C